MNLTILNGGAAGGDSRDASATQEHTLGTMAHGGDGSLYRYVKVGAAPLVAGNTIQGPATVATHLAMTPSAAALGATQVTVTLGAVNAVTANQYTEGWLQVDTTPGNGRRYRIASHPAAAAAAAVTVTLYPDDPIAEAISASSRVGLIANPFSGVIQMPITTATGLLVGVACSAIPAGQYGWVQTHGVAAVLIAGTPALGAIVMSPGAAAGAAEVVTTTNLVVAQTVGRMVQVGAAGKNNAVFLTID